jgi:methionine synthase I (cobalamin-dependent)
MEAHLSGAQIDELAEAGAGVDETLSRHLAECAACREELALARSVAAELDAVPRMAAPPELFDGVMAAVAAKARARQRATFAWAAAAAAAAVAVVVLWLLAGGAAVVAIETIEAVRSLELVTRVATSVWRAVPLELFVLCTFVLVAGSAVLSRLVSRAGARANATAEVG